MALHIKKITHGKMVRGRFVPNPSKRISKTKSRYLSGFGPSSGRLRTMLERRRKPPSARSVYGTPPNKRYWAYPASSTRGEYARTFEAAKRKGAKMARSRGDSTFNVQNNVTASVMTFQVKSGYSISNSKRRPKRRKR